MTIRNPIYMADSGKLQKMGDQDTIPSSMVSWSNPSVGVFADVPPTVTDNGSGNITVGSTTVALAESVSVGAQISKYQIPSATFTIPADSQTYYVCARYSNGAASYYLEVLEGNINARTITPIYACWNILGVVSSQYFGTDGDLLANKIDYAQIDTVPYRRSISGGLTISENNLVWSVTSALVYAGTTPLQISAMTASTSNLIKAYHVGGNWTYSVGSATYDNTNYDNGIALVALGNNKYGVRWIFRSVSNPAQLMYVLGTSYYSNYDAAASELMRTDLPELISKHCILIGKAIVRSGAAAGVTLSTFDVSFAGGAISSDHNALGGIYGDAPFYHLSQPAYTKINNITALSGTGLLKLTSGTPSIDSTSYWSSANHPTTLYNYGITSSDATLDGRYLQLIGGILTGSLFGVNSYLNANENTHDTAPVLTLTNSIYTLGTTLLLAAGTGSTSEIGFSNIGKPAGNQRWNIGVYNDIFYIGGNPTNNTGNLNPYTFSRSGNLGVYGSVTAASFIGPLSGNASSASKIGTARSIALTGDGSWSVSFDGSANVTGALTLATVNSNVGSFGSATTIPTFTVNAKGLTTAASNVAIFIPHTQISDWNTYINQPLLTTSSPTFGTVTANLSGTASVANVLANQGSAVSSASNPSAWPISSGTYSNTIYNQDYPSAYGNVLSIRGTGGNQIFASWNGSNGGLGGLWFRNKRDNYDGWSPWQSVLDSYNYPSFNNFTNGLTTTTLTASGSISEGGTALASKYLGIGASIPSSRISDWGTYINQPLLTTSSPTFGQASLGTWGVVPSFAWFGASGQNNATNGNSGFLQITGSGHIYMCAPASASANIQYNGGDYVTVSADGVSMPNSSGLAVTGPITAKGGISGNLTGNAATASAVAWTGITSKPDGIDNRGAARLYRADITDGYWLSHSWSSVCASYFGCNSWCLTASNSHNDSQGGIHTVLVDYAGLSVNSLQLGGVASSSYLLASTAASTYLSLAGGTMSGNLLGGTPYNIGAASNWWGSIYATTIYESNVALSSKYLGINGTASNASALGGVNADYFVQGSNSSRTTLLTGAVTSQSQLTKSGFYSSSMWTDAPVASTWTHLIHSQYASDGGSANNWSFDIAANFGSAATPGSPENYYVRAIAAGTSTGWRTLLHSGNVGSYAIPLTGSSAITGPLIPYGSTYTLGNASNTWQVFGNIISASGGFEGNLTGNVTGHASLDLPLTGGTISGALTANGGITTTTLSANSATIGGGVFGSPYGWPGGAIYPTGVTPGNDTYVLRWDTYATELNSGVGGVNIGSGNKVSLFVGSDEVVTYSHLFVSGGLSISQEPIDVRYGIYSVNQSRTLDINRMVHIYNVVQSTVQTIPNGTVDGQILFFKNNTQSSITLSGSVNSGSMPIQGSSTCMLIWDDHSHHWC